VVASIEFVCPTCDAKPGEPCRSVAPRSIRNRTKYDSPKAIKKLHADRVARCYRAPMAPKTACGERAGADSERWNDVQCPACLVRQPEIALTYARYCGTEFEANLESSRMRDYFDDCAQQWGFDDWRVLPNDKQLLVRKAFDEGRAAERVARRG
jgi:hypothetical protein